MTAKTKRFSHKKKHVILCGHPAGFIQFITPLRSKKLLKHEIIPVVILSPSPLTDQEMILIGSYEQVFVILVKKMDDFFFFCDSFRVLLWSILILDKLVLEMPVALLS